MECFDRREDQPLRKKDQLLICQRDFQSITGIRKCPGTLGITSEIFFFKKENITLAPVRMRMSGGCVRNGIQAQPSHPVVISSVLKYTTGMPQIDSWQNFHVVCLACEVRTVIVGKDR